MPILGKEKSTKLEMAYLVQGEEGRKRIFEIVDMIKASILSDENLKNTSLLEPPEEQVATQGDFTLGTVLYGKKPLYLLKLNKPDLLTHMGIFGSSGSGKTNIIYSLVSELNKLKIPVVIFDFSKRNYRDLLNIPELKDKIKVYTVGKKISPYRFNPLKPPGGVTITQWAKEFSEVFDHAFSLLGGGRSVILKALGDLYKNFPSVTIPHLLEWIESYEKKQLSQRERNWLATSKRSVESLCFMDTKDIFDCDEDILPSNFFEEGKITILELDSLATDDKTFLVEITLQWIKDWLIAGNVREILKGVIILEEAHNILSREKGKLIGKETVMDIAFREFRELGIGMVYLDQHPSLISYPALGNTSTHIYMNLGLDTKYSSDIEDASKMMGLAEDCIDYLRRLPVGDGFILLRKSVFPNPFLMRFPLSSIVKGSVNDDTVKEVMKISVENIDYQRPNLAKLIRNLDSSDWKIIESLGMGSGASISEISKDVKMSGKVFNQNARRLIALGVIKYETGNVYKQKATYFFLTREGELIFKSKFDMKIDSGCWEDSLVEKYRAKVPMDEKLVVFVDSLDKVAETLDKEEAACFICNSRNVKNRVIQKCALYRNSNPEKRFTVFVADKEDVENNRLKKIGFG